MTQMLGVLVLISAIAPCAAQSPVAETATETAQRLPKVVLVGDSIRLSYTDEVRELLKGEVELVSPAANGGDSANVLRHLQRWVIEQQPDLVHLNCGIHDTKKFHATGEHQVSPEQYANNLRQIVKMIREETDAQVVFATSTPILDERAAQVRKERDYALLNASIQQYNQIAVDVMRELKVPVNDLHRLLAVPPEGIQLPELIVTDGVHLTAAGQQLLAEQVARVVREQLK
ncbi:MAG: SGNH/GDSL hydrolase family protein [Planctomycetaceae bacterium]|nr:SGNH/GDSL hydrolase family protein [Planctomycetaceae bacterium]